VPPSFRGEDFLNFRFGKVQFYAICTKIYSFEQSVNRNLHTLLWHRDWTSDTAYVSAAIQLSKDVRFKTKLLEVKLHIS
jgi:hypothetical protein